MASYLDATGLAYFWGKIKDYVDENGGGGGIAITYSAENEKIIITTSVADGDEVNY